MWAKLREMFGRDVITCAIWLVESQNCARIVSDYSALPSFSFCLVSVEGLCSKTSKILVSLRLFNS